MAKESLAARTGRLSMGVAFIVVVIGLISLSVAVYDKDFTSVVNVTLETDHTGNQLDIASDVKVRGVLVGEVRSIKSEGDGAIIKLALDPGKVKLIPSNVTAEILPKTLFGERYVDLELPNNPAKPIAAGDVIGQDRSSTAIQFAKVLSDLLPVLNALHPAELSATLNALATALNGRGAELGNTIAQFDTYLKKLNPNTDQLVTDLDKLGSVAQVYNAAAPALLDTLSNLQTTSATLTQEQSQFTSLLIGGTNTSAAVANLLTADGQYMIDVAHQTNQVASVLAEYSPEYTCFLGGLAADEPLFVNLFRGNELHVEVQVVQGRGKYVQGNQPKLVDGIGPGCYGLPNPQIPFDIGPYAALIDDGAAYCAGTQNDGSTLPSTGCDIPNGRDTFTTGKASTASASSNALSADAVASTYVGTDPEAAEINALIAGSYGVAPDKVPDIATELAGPLLRGSEVTVK